MGNDEVLFSFDDNPKQILARDYALSATVDIICYGGAIRGGKTFIALGIAWLLMCMFPGYRCVFIRETDLQLKLTTLVSFQKLMPMFEMFGKLKKSGNEYTMPNGSTIVFMAESFNSDKESERFKGLEANSIFIEEISGIQKATFDKCKERKGTWNVKVPKALGDITVPNFIFCTCNPTFEWPRKEFFIPFEARTLQSNVKYIQANANDNPYISDDTKRGWKDTMGYYEYRTFVDGDWNCPVKTEGNYLNCFNPETHVRRVSVDQSLPIHITIDQNVNPYIAVGFWQIDIKHKKLRKVADLACKEKFNMQEVEDPFLRESLRELGLNKPYNRVENAGALAGRYLSKISGSEPWFQHGDAASRAKNSFIPKTFYNAFKDSASKEAGFKPIIDKGRKSSPGVAISGLFMNKIFSAEIAGWSVEISESCINTNTDYLGAKMDDNGHIAKKRVTNPVTKVSYEPHGHFIDGDRYFMIDVFNVEFKKYEKGRLK